jgi:hypothetical protein
MDLVGRFAFCEQFEEVYGDPFVVDVEGAVLREFVQCGYDGLQGER